MLHLAYAELLEFHDCGARDATAAAANGHGSANGHDGSLRGGRAAGLAAARDVYVGLVQLQPTSELAWALLQRFARRADGAQAARRVFRLTRPARLSGELGCHVYLAHALLEW